MMAVIEVTVSKATCTKLKHMRASFEGRFIDAFNSSVTIKSNEHSYANVVELPKRRIHSCHECNSVIDSSSDFDVSVDEIPGFIICPSCNSFVDSIISRGQVQMINENDVAIRIPKSSLDDWSDWLQMNDLSWGAIALEAIEEYLFRGHDETACNKA